MESLIKSKSHRILLERADNGILLYEIREDGEVSARLVYEIYNEQGLMMYDRIADLVYDIADNLRIPVEEPITNRKMAIYVVPIESADTGKEEGDDDSTK